VLNAKSGSTRVAEHCQEHRFAILSVPAVSTGGCCLRTTDAAAGELALTDEQTVEGAASPNETRAADSRVLPLCRALADRDAEATVAAERALLAGLGAGCRTPVAGHAVVAGDSIHIRGLVGRPDASQILKEEMRGPVANAADLGATLATRLLARGADRILADLGDWP
jgi:hypothetical protein